jgi:hypothetical protein
MALVVTDQFGFQTELFCKAFSGFQPVYEQDDTS